MYAGVWDGYRIYICIITTQTSYYVSPFHKFTFFPHLYSFQILDLGIRHDETYVTCTIKRDMVEHVFTISTILVFVLPMTLITILYILIGLQLRRSKVVKRGAISGSSVRLKVSLIHLLICWISSRLSFPQDQIKVLK